MSSSIVIMVQRAAGFALAIGVRGCGSFRWAVPSVFYSPLFVPAWRLSFSSARHVSPACPPFVPSRSFGRRFFFFFLRSLFFLPLFSFFPCFLLCSGFSLLSSSCFVSRSPFLMFFCFFCFLSPAASNSFNFPVVFVVQIVWFCW